MMSSKIKVLLVDDHEMVRMGLATFLNTEDDMEVIGEASDGQSGVDLAFQLKPNVVLMDLVMEPMNGIDATKAIVTKCQKTGDDIKVIVLTSFLDDDKVWPVIEAGAISYVLKTAKATEIADVIRKAYRGETILDGKVQQMMMKKMTHKPTVAKHEQLTAREMDVLKLIGEGKTNQEIANTLYIGIKTVKTHVSNILTKLEVDDRTQAAIYANRHNLCQ